MGGLSRSTVRDVALGVGAAVGLTVITRRVDAAQDSDRVLDALGYGCVVVAGLALSLRQRAPAAGLAVAACAVGIYTARSYPGGPVFIAPLVAAFFLASGRSRARTVPVVVAAGAVVLSAGILDGIGDAGWAPVLYVGWMGAAVLLGESTRARRAQIAAIEDRARYLEATREQEARREAAEERLRVAREVHDVVAHTLAGIALQAGVAARLAQHDPARDALLAIRRSSKEGLAELRTTLNLLRGANGQAPRHPAMGLADLERLIADMAAAGLDVRTRTQGPEHAVSTLVQGAVYRIVQEALTNVVRHAGPARAEVGLTYREGELEVEVVDDGRGIVEAAGGHGIAGMGERVTAAGGRFEAGPRAQGGFRVWALLPTGREP